MQNFRNGTMHKVPVLVWDLGMEVYVPNYTYNQVKLYRPDKKLYTNCCYQVVDNNIITPKMIKIKVYVESDINKMTTML